MSGQTDTRENEIGKCLSHVREEEEEEQTGAALDNEDAESQIRRHGHSGILTMDQEAKMESLTTVRATYVPPKSQDVRLKGIRGELMEKHLAQMISEKIRAELNPPTPKTDFCSTTQRDFSVEGFVPLTPETTQVQDYKTDQAISFWSENHQRIQGVTAVQTPKAPFRKSAFFSTPVGERLDEIEPPPDN
nr:PREDICTED: sperm-associated antigen 8 isoform X1 [Paralichthys olivaceus]XP_019960699.1 PREDICTED: sperm-associated antigen 8 isoform X1 [Paralichthys olivaceus]XP_019960700.1 PREDICTED: sperm-associated antigen 8 isoform X1 [Paralichthys olivaceus]